MRGKLGYKKTAVALAASALLAGGTMAATATNADAAIKWPDQWSHTFTKDNGGWVNVRSCASTSCSVNFSLYGYSPVKTLCWTNGTYVYGTAKWYYIYANANGGYGYVNANLVPDPAPNEPLC